MSPHQSTHPHFKPHRNHTKQISSPNHNFIAIKINQLSTQKKNKNQKGLAFTKITIFKAAAKGRQSQKYNFQAALDR
jgi:hypothetical protein